MNKYQRQRSREIKQIMKGDKFGRMTYPEARRIWNFMRTLSFWTPCEDCATYCHGPYNKIAYCSRNS